MYNNWKLFKTDKTYHSELISVCGEVISESEFKEYLENYGEIQKIDKSIILETLSDGCAASEYIDLNLYNLKKIDTFNEIINGIKNNEALPYPIFERFPNGNLICLDGRHRLLICLKMKIIPSVIVIDMIPANNDKKELINEFRTKYNFNGHRSSLSNL